MNILNMKKSSFEVSKVKKSIIIIGLVLILSFIVSACNTIPSTKVCEINADCVPAYCCHSNEVINKDNKPDCSGVLCSAECAPDTLDCGQAKALCVEGICTMVAQDQI
jgi:hypothetical protein